MPKPLNAANLTVFQVPIPRKSAHDVMDSTCRKFGVMFAEPRYNFDPNRTEPMVGSRPFMCANSSLMLHIGNFASALQVDSWCMLHCKTPIVRNRKQQWSSSAHGLLLILEADQPSRTALQTPAPAIMAVIKPCTPDMNGVLSALGHFPLLVCGTTGACVDHNVLLYTGTHKDIHEVAPVPESTVYPLMQQWVTGALKTSPWEP